MNKEIYFEITGTNRSDYLQFCKTMNINQSDYKSRTLFFKMILDNKLIKDKTINSILIKGDE